MVNINLIEHTNKHVKYWIKCYLYPCLHLIVYLQTMILGWPFVGGRFFDFNCCGIGWLATLLQNFWYLISFNMSPSLPLIMHTNACSPALILAIFVAPSFENTLAASWKESVPCTVSYFLDAANVISNDGATKNGHS